MTDYLKFDPNTDDNLKQWFTHTVKEYWDVFCKDGIKTPVRGYEFHIDTGNHPPIKACLPHYPLHAIPIMDKQIQWLLSLNFITEERTKGE